MSASTETPILSIVLPVKLTNGNDGRQKSWYKPAAVRREFEHLLRIQHGRRIPLARKCRVHVTRILGTGEQLWDSSSILRGNYKELEDALVACGWFVDDSPRWIVQTIGDQDTSRRHLGPAVEIAAYLA